MVVTSAFNEAIALKEWDGQKGERKRALTEAVP